MPVKKLSGLFGGTVSAETASQIPSSRPRSAMFGSTLAVPSTRSKKTARKADQSYLAVLASLARPITPPMAVFEIPPSPPASAPVAEPPAPTQPEQIPYVRPEAREKKPNVNAGEVVVVGRQSKKRKKDKAAANANDSVASAVARKTVRVPVKPEDIPDFDYANEPNQLDTFPEDQSIKVKKQKKVKKRECDDGFVAMAELIPDRTCLSRGGYFQVPQTATGPFSSASWQPVEDIQVEQSSVADAYGDDAMTLHLKRGPSGSS